MKILIVYLILATVLLDGCKGNTHYSQYERSLLSRSLEESIESIPPSDTVMNHIQSKVAEAFALAMISRSDRELVSLEQALLNLNDKMQNSLVVYWYCYACYYHSIHFMIVHEGKKSERILDKGIDLLEEVELKNSEHLALLALMQSFSIQYALGLQAPFISIRVKGNAEKALELDSLNLRAYFVLGSNDFYTPAQYGGGKKAERYLLKCLELKNQSVVNPYLPSWGKNLAYEMLIRYYLNCQQFVQAKKYYQEAIALFPDDYLINKLAVELISH